MNKDICPVRDDAQSHIFENGFCAFCSAPVPMDAFIKNGLTVGSHQTIRNLWAGRSNPYYREVILDNVRQLKRLKLK